MMKGTLDEQNCCVGSLLVQQGTASDSFEPEAAVCFILAGGIYTVLAS